RSRGCGPRSTGSPGHRSDRSPSVCPAQGGVRAGGRGSPPARRALCCPRRGARGSNPRKPCPERRDGVRQPSDGAAGALRPRRRARERDHRGGARGAGVPTMRGMDQRTEDGSAGDADYGAIGSAYSRYRRPDPRIAAVIADALGESRTVLNVGAGTGSYEPQGREVTAVEPSAAMRAQRPEHLPRAVDATAEQLPFADGDFDAAMATFSVHQWKDPAAGLREMRRVTRGPVVVLTCD